MIYTPPPLAHRIVLHPGDHRAARAGKVFQTLLGSCVAACLYDREARVAGMNHFLLANRRYSRNLPMATTEAGRYGIFAMEHLIADMIKLGSDKRRIRAKFFGAGRVMLQRAKGNFECVGEVNERFVKEYIAVEGIPVDSMDLGGDLGRVIYFDTDDYQVYRRYIPRHQTIAVETEEERFWEREIEVAPGGAEVVLFDS